MSRNSHNPEWECSVQEVKNLLDRGSAVLLLDVRQPEEHALCRIEPSRLIPLPDLPRRLEEALELAANRTVIAFCHHGGRSLQAAALLRQAGIAGAKSMAGGIDAWSLHVDSAVPRY